MKALTIRSLPPEVADALEKEKKRRGTSLNQTVIDLLGQGLGVSGLRVNGLARLGGSWTVEQHREFKEAVAPFDEVDAEIWR